MQPRRFSSSVLACLAIVLGAVGVLADDFAVAIRPADGSGVLLKRFRVDQPIMVLGAQFGTNDARTIFPEVSLLSLDGGNLRGRTEFARVVNVRRGDDGAVHAMWTAPVLLEVPGDYYIAIRMPSGDIKRAPGDGAGVIASAMQSGDSFGASGTAGELVAIEVALDVSVITAESVRTPASKAVASSGSDDAPLKSFLKVRQQRGGTVLRITFGVPTQGWGSVVIFDVGGRRVATLESGVFIPGVHTLDWDGRSDRGFAVARGIYVVRLVVDATSLTQKLVLDK